MAQPFEQEIILDADGRPVFSAFEYVQKQVQQLQKTINQIGKDSYKNVQDAGRAIEANVKNLRQALAQLKTLTQPGTKEGDYLAALKQREAQLKQEGQTARVIYRQETQDRRESVAAQVLAEREGAAQVSRINRERMTVDAESAKNLQRARIEAARAGLIDEAKQITTLERMAVVRADNIAKLRQYREAARAETDPVQQRALATLIELERARGAALEVTNRRLQQQQNLADRRFQGLANKQASLLVPQQVESAVAYTGVSTAREAAIAEQMVARRALLAASTTEEIALATRNLELANLRVAAVTRIANEEARAAAALELQNTRQNTDAQKARLVLSHQYAVEQVNTLGIDEAIRVQKMRQVEAEQALRMATAETRQVLMQNLQLENARLQAIEREGQRQVQQRGPVGNIVSPGYAAAAFARTAVYGAAALAAYGAYNTVQQGIAQAINMEEELKNLQAIANASDGQLQTLKGTIYEIGTASKYSLTDIISISKVLAQAGVSAGDMGNALKSVVQLATASGSSLDEAAQLVTSAAGAFQLNADEFGRIADLMTVALNRTKLTVQQTGLAIQYVGATAYENNITLEQLLATVGAMAQAGIKSGSTMGTGLRQLFVGLQTPTEKLIKQLKLLGLSVNDVDVATRGESAVLDTLANAGFGAGQAYSGLEHRAAAAYLVLKNNRGTIEELEKDFAQENAAVIANQRAMDSLGAQWKVFKNIVAEGFESRLSSALDVIKNILKEVNDSMSRAEDLQKNQPKSALQSFGQGFAHVDESVTNALLTAGRYAVRGLNIPNDIGLSKGNRAGDDILRWYDEFNNAQQTAESRSEQLAAQFNETSDTVDKQRSLIAELDKETLRLAIQKDSLRGNDARSSAEMVTLMSRFDGLGAYIIQTGNLYDDLTAAVKRFRAAQLDALNVSLQGQAAAAEQMTTEARRTGGQLIGQIQHNQGWMNQLNPAERNALNTLRTGHITGPEYPAAQSILRAAATRVQGQPGGADLADNLRKLTIAAGDAATGLSRTAGITQQISSNTAANTDVGQHILNMVDDSRGTIPALIAQMQGMQNNTPEKDKVIVEARKQIAEAETYIKGQLAKPNLDPSLRNLLTTSLSGIPSLRQQVTGAGAETDAEKREREKAERERRKREREAERNDQRPLVTQSDIDRIARTVTTLAFGRGHDESPEARAREDAMHRQGLTPATGDTSGHTARGATGRDIPIPSTMTDAEGQRLAVTLRNAYRNAGIEAFVQFETGKGRNQGTGRHVHVSTPKGLRYKAGSRQGAAGVDDQDFKYDTQLDQAQIAIDQHELATKLKEAAKAVTSETFKAAADAGQKALEKVNDDIMTAALDELANAGILAGTPEFEAKIRQVKDQQQQNIEDFQNKLADAILKSAEAQFKAAEQAYTENIRPAQQISEIAQARVQGLNYESLSGRVPDFVKTTAEHRAGLTSEALDQAKLAALPAQIAAQQKAVTTAQEELKSIKKYNDDGSETAAYQSAAQGVATLNAQLKTLIDTQSALAAQLDAASQIPKNLSEALHMAAEAYIEANHLNNTFAQDLMNNMTGAIDTVNQSLTDMFTSIMDGSRSATQAFGDFAKAIMRYIIQIVAKIIASKIVTLLLSLAQAAGGEGNIPAEAKIPLDPSGGATGLFKGGTPFDRLPGYAGGGEVMNGSASNDSVIAKIARGEWMINRRAVASVGNKFMARLNKHGAKALDDIRQMPQINVSPQLHANIWMVRPDTPPQLGPHDILITWAQDVLSGGESRKLIKAVALEG